MPKNDLLKGQQVAMIGYVAGAPNDDGYCKVHFMPHANTQGDGVVSYNMQMDIHKDYLKFIGDPFVEIRAR